MQTTNYICDICKTSKSQTDLSQIIVNTRGITISQNHYHADIKFDICKDCLKKKGFIVNPIPEEQNKEEVGKSNNKTLENKIIEILDDLGVQFYE